jgi:transposase InsO family protein
MKEWFTARELADLALPAMGEHRRSHQMRATRNSWRSRPRLGRGGGREYHVSSLPEAARLELARRAMAEAGAVAATFEGRAELASATGALAGLVGKARQRAEARLALVNLFETWRASSGVSLRVGFEVFAQTWSAGALDGPDWLRAALPRVSAPSLKRWRRVAGAGDAAALAGCWQGERDGLIDSNPKLRDLIAALILDRPHVNALHVLKALEARLPGERIPSLRGLRRWIARWRAEHATLVARAENPDAAKRYRPAFGGASESITRLNQVWESDATPADVLCRDGRHVVVGMIDVATRRARVLVVRTSKAQAVLALLKRCILDWGLPELLTTDNGRDFTARAVATALAALQIRHKTCAPFTPEGKPHIERFFGTLTRQLFALLPGFAGHDVAQRQAIRARASFAKRLGEGDDALYRVELTAAELQKACDDWLTADYERSDHSGLGATPMLAAAQLAQQARRVADERALDVLLSPAPGDGGWRVCGKKGVRVERFSYIAAELGALVGERVQVRLDPTDLGRVVVYDSAGAFVCVAEDPTVTGVDRAELASRARAASLDAEREGRAYVRALKKRQRPEDLAREILASQAEAAAKIVAFPARGESVTTPDLDEAALAAQALDDPQAPRPSYEDLTEQERQPRSAEVIPLTLDPDPWPGWGAEPIDIWDWSQRNPAKGADGLTPEQLAARIESWRPEYPGLDLWIRKKTEQRTA